MLFFKTDAKKRDSKHTMLLRTGTGAVLVAGTGFAYWWYSLPTIACAWAILFFLMLRYEWPAFKMGWLTPLYPGISMISIILLHLYAATWICVATLLMAAGADTGGYFIGQRWGKHPIAYAISPGKSWEGFFGGYVMTIGVVYGMVWWYVLPYQWFGILCLSTYGAIFALGGDLFESYLKRRAGLKNSGTVLPGHGGCFDRLDSVFGVAPGMLLWWLVVHCR